MHRADTTDATVSGVVKTGGICSIASGVITNLTNATDIDVGDWVTMNKGFDTQRFKALARTATTLTVDGIASTSETGVTVTVVGNMYTIGDGVAINRTVYGPDQANTLQEEISNLVEDAGLSLDKKDNKQLIRSVLKKTGDTASGPMIFQDDVKSKNIKYEKYNTGTVADSSEDIEIYKTKLNITALAVATNKVLFTFPTADKKIIGLRIKGIYDLGAATKMFNFDIVTRTGEDASPPFIDRSVIVPEYQDFDFSSATVIKNFGGLYFHLIENSSFSNDSQWDGTAAANDAPMFIIRKNQLEIRNSNTGTVLNNIKLFIEMYNLV